jgi:hypothetical protein
VYDDAVADFVARLRSTQERLLCSEWSQFAPGAIADQEWSSLYGTTRFGLAVAQSWPEHISWITTLFVEWCDTIRDTEHEHAVSLGKAADNLRKLLNAMKLQCDGSIMEYELSRQFVWLRQRNKPTHALTGFKVEESWFGRVTRSNREYASFGLDGNGSELYIYTQEVLPGLITYHWYIAGTGRRNVIARGTSSTLEWAAEQIYREYFGLITNSLFTRAMQPEVGKEIVVFNTDRSKFNGIITKAEKINPRQTDPFNWRLVVDGKYEVTGLDWYVRKPEQYIEGNYPLQCRRCQHVSPKAFDIRWVQGYGPLCGPSRDNYWDEGIITDHDFD